jgi:predicted RNA methylase
MIPTCAKRDYLFKFVPPDKREQLLLDDEAGYSVTDQYTADRITRDIMRFVSAKGAICDATACIGGNTYSFARAFRRVVAIERNPVRFHYLQHNMSVLDVHNVTFQLGDAIDEVQWGRPFHCIFLDPPWGGPGYKRATRVDLSLSELPLVDVCRRMAPCAAFFAIKTPTNFNLEAFVEATRDFLTLVWHNTQLRKIHLVVFEVAK